MMIMNFYHIIFLEIRWWFSLFFLLMLQAMNISFGTVENLNHYI